MASAHICLLCFFVYSETPPTDYIAKPTIHGSTSIMLTLEKNGGADGCISKVVRVGGLEWLRWLGCVCFLLGGLGRTPEFLLLLLCLILSNSHC